MRVDSSVKLPRPPRQHKERQQVAAVCYRIRKNAIQFLLVQTRGGRWIFPKGGVEPGMTHAQSAAVEAFEEAGVHGRIEEIPFTRYFRHKTDNAATSSDAECPVFAHLCEVSRLERTPEQNRTPTWFSAEKAKQRLREHRTREFGAELCRVIDRALLRIDRLHSLARNPSHPVHHRDGLQKVHFDAFDGAQLRDDLAGAAIARHLIRQRRNPRSPAIDFNLQPYLHLGRFLPVEIHRPILRLGSGTSSLAGTSRNITAIDSRSKAKSATLLDKGKRRS